MATFGWSRSAKANRNEAARHLCVEGLQVGSVRDYEGSECVGRRMDEEVITVEGGNQVFAVDISLDSARFSTGTNKAEVSIWSMTKGERLVGPLQHDEQVTGTRFSPNGEQIATACYRGSRIRVFDSRSGDELITIDTTTPQVAAITPLAWSSDGQRIFAASESDKISSFDVSTGAQLAELQIPSRLIRGVHSLALAPNCKFIATFAHQSISFLDASTLAQAGPVIEDTNIRSIAISQDNTYLATGHFYGKIIVRNLSQILPDLYGPFHVSICLYGPAMLDRPHSVLYVDKLHRYPLTVKCNKTNCLREWTATTTKLLALIP